MFTTCPNFRDLGGFATQDGRLVKTGHVFRAGTLAKLGPADHDVIAGFGIKTICDLRQPSEAALEPTAWPDATVLHLRWTYGSVIARVMAPLMAPDATPELADACMAAFYAEQPVVMAAPIRGVFAAIAQGATPLLFHCSAGKDRTGVLAGLLQDVLGMRREDILADYARSAQLVDFEGLMSRNPDSSLGLSRDGFSIAKLSKPLRARLLATEPAYLAAMFAKIEAESGSVKAYLTEVIGVDLAHIDRVRAVLLD
jgi:protein-tyrosine phosphatase